MAVEIKKVMETDEKGVARQIYPETHVDAIIGFNLGDISISVKDLPLANESQNGLMTTDMFKKINQLEQTNTITMEKVGEVE